MSIPEIKSGLPSKVGWQPRTTKETPFHNGIITIITLIIAASAWGTIHSSLLMASPQYVEAEKSIALLRLNDPRKTHFSGRRDRRDTKQFVKDGIRKRMQVAKIEAGVGIIRMLLSLTLIVSAVACILRTKWAWLVTRWGSLAAFFITTVQYGCFAFSFHHLPSDVLCSLGRISSIVLAISGLLCWILLSSIYVGGWRVLGFPANREIFGASINGGFR